MFYLLIAIINAIYGILLLLTISKDTPGYLIVFIIGALLTVLGISGFVIWLRGVIKTEGEPSKNEALKSWFSIARSFDIVLILGLIFRAFILQPFIVEGNSMEPNYHNGEILLVDKLTYDFRTPTRGEIVIFKAPPDPQSDYIKRVIGIPGDTIVIENGQVSINGKILNEKYTEKGSVTLAGGSKSIIFRQTLQPGEYFVMGDNRLYSSDSREWGVLPKMNIIGRAIVIVYPFSDFGLVHNQKMDLSKNKNALANLLLQNPEFVRRIHKIGQ